MWMETGGHQIFDFKSSLQVNRCFKNSGKVKVAEFGHCFEHSLGALCILCKPDRGAASSDESRPSRGACRAETRE